tara:strand:+ start:52 stop:2061 length:2010 start_codon:yes stop_codon:yes gene_type:complete
MRKGNLENIFGGAFSLRNIESIKKVLPIEEQAENAMISAGLNPPINIVFDGNIHRFDGAKKGDKACWYIFFSDGIPAGRFGNWKTGLECPWRADVGRELTPADEMIHARRMAEARVLRDAQVARTHEVAANTVETIWSNCGHASPEHPYLRRKGIDTHGARVTGDGRLVVPLFDEDGALSTLQYIDAEGGKLYHAGGQTGGMFWMLGTMDEPGVLYMAEGFATAATIHEATGRPCAVAYSASNLVPVCGTLRTLYGVNQSIVIVADNDKSGVGQKYAEQASAKFGARVVMPAEPGDANDFAQGGGDLLGLLVPQTSGWLVRADEFCQQPAPISWIVKHWLQEQALIMVHGPSGGGKTFVVLDWCLRVAAGVSEWAGSRVKPGTVVYLAGEGHHGLRGRVAAWKHHQRSGPLSMWLSKDGCDLNTPTGYQKVLESVGALDRRPDLIVVDTLHRFLLGDENSAQDAKTMLDACGALMRAFDCSVILVHHTGVSDEAQHRARGSSAWRGALDIEISIVPGKDGAPLEIVQRKSKDAEMAQPVFAELTPVQIPGWYDEDGEPVGSAVVEVVAAPTPAKKDSKLDSLRKQFEAAWWASGAEDREGLPYVTRAGLRSKLIEDGCSEATADKKMKPGSADQLVGALIIAGIIKPDDNGWVVCSSVHAAALMLSKCG